VVAGEAGEEEDAHKGRRWSWEATDCATVMGGKENRLSPRAGTLVGLKVGNFPPSYFCFLSEIERTSALDWL
jgi:hypothetical protein